MSGRGPFQTLLILHFTCINYQMAFLLGGLWWGGMGVGLNVRGESLTLRSCCLRILLLFCCYCSTLQHGSVPNVHLP